MRIGAVVWSAVAVGVFGVCGVFGCAGGDDLPPPPLADPCDAIVLVTEPGASDGERAAIGDAAEMWATVASTRMTLAGTETVDPAPTAIPIRFAPAALAFLGAYEVERKDLVINSDIPDRATRAIVVAHELGHAFGLVHVQGRDSIMNAGNGTIPPNALDAADLAARWGICPR
jgi:hypothetical protein